MPANDFEANFKGFTAKVENTLAEKAVARAGFLLLRDAVMDVPMVPLDEGTLKGSGSLFVGRQLVTTSAPFASGNPKAKPTPATELDRDQSRTVATVGFNTPYAARMHEGTSFEFQHAGHGAKFLEQKLIENHNAYVAAMNEYMNEHWLEGVA